MFGLGFPELLLIFVIALIVFGPKKLPELGKSIGRAMAEFKKASDDFQESMRTEMKEVEKSAGVEELKKLDNYDPLTHDQAEAPKPEIEQGPEEKQEKQEENKTGEAKRNA
jgi:sec-independent protein translocase protein TatA